MLSEPLPLGERGMYSLDVKIEKVFSSSVNKAKLSFVSTYPYARHNHDSIAWFEQVGSKQIKNKTDKIDPLGSISLTDKHTCKRKSLEEAFCAQCGLNLDANYNNCSEVTRIPVRYVSTISNPEYMKGTHIITINRPSTSAEMSQHLLYLIGSNYQSVTERYRTLEKLPTSITSSLTKRIVMSVNGVAVPIFDSNFESGNLAQVYYVNPNEYDLYLHNDANTRGHTQWFFFSVAVYDNLEGRKITFNIRNMVKSKSLFSKGQKLYVLSSHQKAAEGVGWELSGENFSYEKNELQRQVLQKASVIGEEDEDEMENKEKALLLAKTQGEIEPERRQNPKARQKDNKGNQEANADGEELEKRTYYYSTLSFSYTFKYAFDKVYFAYFLPYNFTDLTTFLIEIENKLQQDAQPGNKIPTQYNSAPDPDSSTAEFEPVCIVTRDIVYKREKICSTIAGIPLYMLTITGVCKRKSDDSKKKGAFICARVHPGESNSSFVVQGLIKFLLSGSDAAQRILKCYVFKIVPMLNPEGVAVGNNRTSLSGADLNRRWLEPNEKLHPEIYTTKKLVKQFQKERELLVFCDIHGHSKKKSAFMYGCSMLSEGGFNSWTRVRLLPKIFAKRSPMFSFQDCNFKVTANKMGTARVVVWREFKVVNSFTLEVSLYGYTSGDEVIPFNQESLETLGRDFGLSLHDFYYVHERFDFEIVENKGMLSPHGQSPRGENEEFGFKKGPRIHTKTSQLDPESTSFDESNKGLHTEFVRGRFHNFRGSEGIKISQEGFRGSLEEWKEVTPKSLEKGNRRDMMTTSNEIAQSQCKALKILPDLPRQSHTRTRTHQSTFDDKSDNAGIYFLSSTKASRLVQNAFEGPDDTHEEGFDGFLPDWREFFDPVELKEKYESIQAGEIKEANSDSDADTVSKQSKEDAETAQEELANIQTAQINAIKEPPAMKTPTAGRRLAVPKLTKNAKFEKPSSVPRPRVVRLVDKRSLSSESNEQNSIENQNDKGTNDEMSYRKNSIYNQTSHRPTIEAYHVKDRTVEASEMPHFQGIPVNLVELSNPDQTKPVKIAGTSVSQHYHNVRKLRESFIRTRPKTLSSHKEYDVAHPNAASDLKQAKIPIKKNSQGNGYIGPESWTLSTQINLSSEKASVNNPYLRRLLLSQKANTTPMHGRAASNSRGPQANKKPQNFSESQEVGSSLIEDDRVLREFRILKTGFSKNLPEIFSLKTPAERGNTSPQPLGGFSRKTEGESRMSAMPNYYRSDSTGHNANAGTKAEVKLKNYLGGLKANNNKNLPIDKRKSALIREKILNNINSTQETMKSNSILHRTIYNMTHIKDTSLAIFDQNDSIMSMKLDLFRK